MTSGSHRRQHMFPALVPAILVFFLAIVVPSGCVVTVAPTGSGAAPAGGTPALATPGVVRLEPVAFLPLLPGPETGGKPAEVQARPTSTLRSTPAPTQPSQRVRVPILMYHHLKVLGANPSATWRDVTVTPAAFEQQVTYLAEHGYRTIRFADLVAYFDQGLPLPANPVIITFDDGWEDGYTIAFPALQRHQMTATFFVQTSTVGRSSGTLTWTQIEEMQAAGMEFGSHSVSHGYLTRQRAATAEWELESSRAVLEEHLGRPVIAFAYPFGAYSTAVVRQTGLAGYRAAVTTRTGAWAEASGLLALPRIAVPYGLGLEGFAQRLQMQSEAQTAAR